jgi:hypothetical protein
MDASHAHPSRDESLTMMSRRTHDIYIDQLVVDGLETGDRDGIASGLRAGIEQALARPGIADHLVDDQYHAALDAGMIQVEPSSAGPTLGRAAGRAAAEAIFLGEGEAVITSENVHQDPGTSDGME